MLFQERTSICMHILICASEANTRMKRYNLSLVYVTWKAKTDTNALPFNEKNRLLSV